MQAELMDYIIKIIDYVAEHPNAEFEIWNDGGDGTDDARYPRLYVTFGFYDKYGRIRRIGRDDNVHWSTLLDATEDNLRYIVDWLRKDGETK